MTYSLNKKQLFELHSKNDCSEWRENIEEIISEICSTKSDKIELAHDSKYVKLLLEKGSKDQKDLVSKYGIDLNIGCITNKIKTFEDALAIVGCSESIKFILGYTGDDKDMLAQVALAKLTIIIRALNEGWFPNWLDKTESKWHVWSQFGSLGWSYDGYGYYNTASTVGSRLMIRNKKLAEYVGTHFAPLYNDLFSL